MYLLLIQWFRDYNIERGVHMSSVVVVGTQWGDEGKGKSQTSQ